MKPGPNFEKNHLAAGSTRFLSLPAAVRLLADSLDRFCHAICGGQNLTTRIQFHAEDRDAFAQTA
jgi:hypothetical protein